MDRKKMKIRIEIAEKPYKLTISVDEEEGVRRAAKHIEEQIKALKGIHDTSLIDYLAMAAINISIENEKNKERLKLAPEALRLRALASQLDHWVAENEKSDLSAQIVVMPKTKAKRGRKKKSDIL